jgi:hypothetical protein
MQAATRAHRLEESRKLAVEITSARFAHAETALRKVHASYKS